MCPHSGSIYGIYGRYGIYGIYWRSLHLVEVVEKRVPLIWLIVYEYSISQMTPDPQWVQMSVPT